MAEQRTAAYKPVPPGYGGWRCGTDADGNCLCGEPDGIDPSQVACPHGVLVPEPSAQRTVSDIYASAREAIRKLLALLDDPHPGSATWHGAVARARVAVIEELES